MASVIRGSDNFDSADRGVAVADQWRLTTSVTFIKLGAAQ